MTAFLLGVPGKLKILLDRLTDTRAANLDYLDAPISGVGGGGSVIKSIQRGWTAVSSAELDVTITGVDLNKSLVVATYQGSYEAVARLTSATNVKLSRSIASGTTMVAWQVIEYE